VAPAVRAGRGKLQGPIYDLSHARAAVGRSLRRC